MTRILLALLLCFALPAQAMSPGFMAGTKMHKAAAAGCTTNAETQTTQSTSLGTVFRYANNRDRIASKFTAAAPTGNRCSLTVRLGGKVADVGTTLHAEIWTDDGGSPSAPSAKTGGDSGTVNWSAVSTDALTDSDTFNHTFTWTANYPSLTEGTVYWIVLVTDWTTGNGDYCSVGQRGSESNMIAFYDRDTTTWSVLDNARIYYVIKR